MENRSNNSPKHGRHSPVDFQYVFSVGMNKMLNININGDSYMIVSNKRITI